MTPKLVATTEPVERQCANWLDSFVEWSQLLPAPDLYRKWTAYAALAGALERKVWIKTAKGILYPHLYTILVGPPGVGKTILTAPVERFWGTLKEHHLAPSSTTKAALMDALNEARRIVVRVGETPPTYEFNSLLVNSNELGVLLPAYDNEFMNTLTDMWNAGPYRERKRGNQLKIEIPRPQLNLLAATSPSYLNGVLPEGAWDQGFMSRCILVYSGENVRRSLFAELETNEELERNLIADLDIISKQFGLLRFTTEARDMIEAWDAAGPPPTPDHPRLLGYNSRRLEHVLKLTMLECLGETNDRVIEAKHFDRARDNLIEVEAYVPDIFKAMRNGGDANAIRDAFHYVLEYNMKAGKMMPEHMLVEFVQNRVPAHSVIRVIELMVKGKMLAIKFDPKVSQNFYQARDKKDI